MNASLIFGATALAWLLSALTLVVAGLLWWPCRKQGLLASVPWLIAFSILSGSLGMFRLGLPDFISKAPSEDSLTLPMWGCMYLLLGAFKSFVSVFMIIINAAFLLRDRVESSLVSRLASMHRHQAILGVILLLLAFLPVLPVLYEKVLMVH